MVVYLYPQDPKFCYGYSDLVPATVDVRDGHELYRILDSAKDEGTGEKDYQYR